MTRTFDHKIEALKFRIWAYAKPSGWDVTVSDAAKATGASKKEVLAIAREAGWSQRFRVESTYLARAVNPMIAAHMAADIVAGRIGVSL